jgi:hypothetical protein
MGMRRHTVLAVRAIHRRVRHGDAQRGALSLFVAIMFTGMVLVIGLVVDSGGRLDAGVNADEYANEAARAGIQRINAADAIAGKSIQVNCNTKTGAPAAVQTYLSQVGMVGSTTLCNATTVEVSVRTSYKTKVLSIIGIDSFPITVSGEATLVTGQQQPNSE